MTLTIVSSPTVDTIRRHARHDHGFDPEHIEHTGAAVLLYEHERAHSQFSAHKTPHRHHDTITGDDLAGMTNERLAGILEGVPLDGLAELAAAEAARRLRAPEPAGDGLTAQAIARDDILTLAHAIAGELDGLDDPLASDEWQAVTRLAHALDVALVDIAPRPRREEPPID